MIACLLWPAQDGTRDKERQPKCQAWPSAFYKIIFRQFHTFKNSDLLIHLNRTVHLRLHSDRVSKRCHSHSLQQVSGFRTVGTGTTRGSSKTTKPHAEKKLNLVWLVLQCNTTSFLVDSFFESHVSCVLLEIAMTKVKQLLWEYVSAVV